jgi:predicted amidophosphoribosyltransferase
MNEDKPIFCSNCGKKLEPNQELRTCPKCDADLKAHSASEPSSVEHLPYKNPGTTALLAFYRWYTSFTRHRSHLCLKSGNGCWNINWWFYLLCTYF